MKITPIRRRRISANIEIDDAINQLNISKSTFYKIEQGHLKPSARLIARISKLYDCSIDDVFKDLKIS